MLRDLGLAVDAAGKAGRAGPPPRMVSRRGDLVRARVLLGPRRSREQQADPQASRVRRLRERDAVFQRLGCRAALPSLSGVV
jgi:hypothetical protein